MAKKNKKSKGFTEGAEFSFLGNLFGVMLSCTGLLAGSMVRERSFDYWLEDLMPLLLLLITARGVIRSGLDLINDSIFYEEQKKYAAEALAMRSQLEEDELELPKIAPKSKTQYTEEEILEAVSKRIEQNRAAAAAKGQ